MYSSLAFLWCVYRASACASSAVDACIRIDGVLLIASCDSFNRAFFDASAAVDAVVINYISHGCKTRLTERRGKMRSTL